jgi:carbonic anhydrase
MNKLPLLTLMLSAVVACTEDDDESRVSTSTGASGAGSSAWSYDGATGPANWGSLDPSYAQCAESDLQSPVDLSSKAVPVDVPDLVPSYGESSVAIVNNGHTLEFEYDPGSKVTLGGAEYALKQFHFHAHSEHSIDGQFAPLEMHLVHADAEGNKVVLALLVAPGAENETLDDASWAHLPRRPLDRYEDADARFNVSELLPGGPTYRYAGSLTTPPCTENVSWVVFRAPIQLSRAQIAAFTAINDHDARPAQPLGQRVVSGGE